MGFHLDARYERVREEGVIRSQAVLLAIGIGWDARRAPGSQRRPRGSARSGSACASSGGYTTGVTSPKRGAISPLGWPNGRRPIPSSVPGSRSTSRRLSPSTACRVSTTKHLKSTNLLERLNEEIKRRAHVVRILPNAESCLRLIRALAVEMHENWLEAHRYLNMDDLREHKEEALRMAA